MVYHPVANPLHVGSNPILTSATKQGDSPLEGEGRSAAVCTSVCTPLDEGALQAAIDRLTRALATAADDDIPALVEERRSLREELQATREGVAEGVRLERARRGT